MHLYFGKSGYHACVGRFTSAHFCLHPPAAHSSLPPCHVRVPSPPDSDDVQHSRHSDNLKAP